MFKNSLYPSWDVGYYLKPDCKNYIYIDTKHQFSMSTGAGFFLGNCDQFTSFPWWADGIYLSQDYQQRKHRLYTKEWYKLSWQHVLHNLGRLYFVFCSVSVLLQSKGPHRRGDPHCRRGGGAGGEGGGSTAGNAGNDGSLAVTDDEEDEEEDIFVSAKKSLLVCLMFLCFLFMAPPVKVIALLSLSCFGEPEVLSTRWDNQHCSYM